ncbi:hypothetical protein CLV34_2134 [Luteimicrobium subarcticum]|uniref:Restriction endonuclease n=1 Tax=Luteimicrobium subarcticum TaxID=620910 RepID=A0A2M8WRM5_9MICO|nr:hypothetical protein CLV34_2134 [Luteimicrobium subarcticum]
MPVRDFWSYAMSDLQSNATRGVLAEYLVARAVRATGPRIEWDAYDVAAPDGTTIEVKASGYSQAWERRSEPSIRFGGLPGRPGKQSWHADTATMEAGFVADVYVFAVHTTTSADPYDGLDISAWQFYVLRGDDVAATGQSSMQLTTVVRLGGVPVAWHELADAIAAARPAAPVNAVVEVSPARVGHLPGCPHKGDADRSRWGRVLRPGAWRDLCNGSTVVTDDPTMIEGLTAKAACKDCVARS